VCWLRPTISCPGDDKGDIEASGDYRGLWGLADQYEIACEVLGGADNLPGRPVCGLYRAEFAADPLSRGGGKDPLFAEKGSAIYTPGNMWGTAPVTLAGNMVKPGRVSGGAVLSSSNAGRGRHHEAVTSV
jgi:hypothetical protein